MNIIPAIDLRDGGVVRLRQGDFTQTRRFDATPLDTAVRYAHAGARWLHAVDLDGARAAHPVHLDLLRTLANTGLYVQWGGGVRTSSDLDAVFDAGATRVVVGSVAVTAPRRFHDWLERYSGDRLCLALDLRQRSDGDWQPGISAWQETLDIDVEAFVDGLSQRGLIHVLSTDIDRDGMAAGPNLALYAWLVRRWPALQWIASGGVRDLDDVAALADAGVTACVAGTALLDGTLPLAALGAGED